jgi:GAF domain-containing protein
VDRRRQQDLAEKRGGGLFTDDEELMTGLAVAAGAAIENARLYAQTRRRQRWLEAADRPGSARCGDPAAVRGRHAVAGLLRTCQALVGALLAV